MYQIIWEGMTVTRSVLVEIRLPAADCSYDVRLPLGLNMHLCSMLTAQALAAMAEGFYLPSKTSFLAWQSTGEKIDSFQTVEEAGIRNGSKLLLI